MEGCGISTKKEARQASSICKEMAKEVEKLVNEKPMEEGGYEAVNKCFNEQLKENDIEYFVLMDQNCIAVVHTNPFR